jgi:hypothetical protein
MRTLSWNTVIEALVLVRIGQELGTHSPFARALHDLVSAVLAIGG